MRSLSYNLSDASNPELRARVLQGEVTPDRLVQMTPAEMASKVSGHNFQQLLRTAAAKQCVDLFLLSHAASQTLIAPVGVVQKLPLKYCFRRVAVQSLL